MPAAPDAVIGRATTRAILADPLTQVRLSGGASYRAGRAVAPGRLLVHVVRDGCIDNDLSVNVKAGVNNPVAVVLGPPR